MTRFCNVPVETQKDRPHRIVEAAVGNMHVDDGLRLACNLIPHLDGFQEPPRCRHDGRSTHIFLGMRIPLGMRILGGVCECRVRNRDHERRAQRPPKRKSKRQTGKSGATDQDVDALRGFDH